MNAFDEDYFYGRKKSNYSNYEKMNASRKFKTFIDFITEKKITGRFLDVGCAFGLLLEEVAPYFDELLGCDISEFAIEKARRRCPDFNFRIVDIEKSIPYPDESFDCIAAIDVLEHTKSFKASFQNLMPKLKTGGYMMLSTPLDSWARKLFGFFDKDRTHISILKENKLKIIIREQKLTILKQFKYAPTPIRRKIPRIPAQIELVLKK